MQNAADKNTCYSISNIVGIIIKNSLLHYIYCKHLILYNLYFCISLIDYSLIIVLFCLKSIK